jgi:hypothetical protein
MSAEAWVGLAGLGVTLALALLVQLGMILRSTGKTEEAIKNLQASVQAVHKRIDTSETAREAAEQINRDDHQALRDEMETGLNNLGADVVAIHDALLEKGIIAASNGSGFSRVQR